MGWKQKEVDEVTNTQEATLDEGSSKGNLTPIALLGIERLIKLFEERARNAPESHPEAPWERSVNGSPKCGCGECDSAGWVYIEGKGVKLCQAQSSRSGRPTGHAKELAEGASDKGSLDFRAIFKSEAKR